MGKMYDVLQKRKKEQSIKLDSFPGTKLRKSVSEEHEIAVAEEFCTLHGCSPKLFVLSDPDSIDAANFRDLRAVVLFSGDHNFPKTIMVTSAFPAEGKTTVAANLAVAIAIGIDNYVLLVDCDFYRPQLHEMLGLKNSQGLHAHLERKNPLEKLIIPTQIERLSFLPAGQSSSNPSEVLCSSAMEAFFSDVRKLYPDRFIIIDAPPSYMAAETSVMSRHVDAVILVIMAERSPRKQIQKSIQNLGKEKILGIVFNGFHDAFTPYNKHYGRYGYYK